MSGALLQLLLGIAILYGGMELAARGAVQLLRGVKVPAVFIGIVVAANVPVLPSLMVSMQSALNASPGVALGNVAGVVCLLLTLVPGIAALKTPLTTSPEWAKRDGIVLVLAAAAFPWLAQDGMISRPEGMALLGAFVFYLLYCVMTPLKREVSVASANDYTMRDKNCLWCAVAYALVGLGMLMTGSDIAVGGVVRSAKLYELSEMQAGFALAAAGSVLPVLVIALVAAQRGKGDIVIPAVVTGAIANLLGVLGFAAFINPIPAGAAFARAYSLLPVGVALISVCILILRLTPRRREGGFFLVLFALIILYQLHFAPGAA